MTKQQKTKKEQEREILQAVVIADDYSNNFYPLTVSLPKCLLPIADHTLLDNTLQSLYSSGIEQSFIFVSQNPVLIKRHVEKYWSSKTRQMEVVVVQAENCHSLGDALREIDSRHLVPGDFVLLYGDTVANLNFKSLLELFKQRRQTEKKMIMACLMKTLQPGHQNRPQEDDVFIVTKVDNQQLLLYQKCNGLDQLELPLDFLSEHKQLQVRHDLADCQIALCSPFVPSLFSDNFDFQTIEDFIKGILMNEEILGYTIAVEVIRKDYAARMTNLQMLLSIGLDIINRWSFPIVPDLTSNSYIHQRHNIYLHKEAVVSGNCQLKEDIIIGQGSSVGENAVITKSIIGSDCKIGNEVVIENSYIMDRTVISDKCHIKGAFIGSDVYLSPDVSISQNCVLGDKVKIGRNIKLNLSERIVNLPNEATETSVVGNDGQGQLVKVMPGEEEDDEWDESESENDLDSDADKEDEPEEDDIVNEFGRFCSELMDTLQNNTSNDVDNQVIEVNSLKSAFGLQIRDVRRLLVKCIVELPLVQKPKSEKEYRQQFSSVMKRFKNLLLKFIKARQDQLDGLEEIVYIVEVEGVISKSMTVVDYDKIIETIDKLIMEKNPVLAESVQYVLHSLYDEDILSEEVFLEWFNIYKTKGKVNGKVQDFADWLSKTDESDESD